MRLHETHYARMKYALSSVYHEKEKAEIDAIWQTKTMTSIRCLGHQDFKAGYLMRFENLVWRLAPVACVLIFIFSVCLLNIDFAQEYEMAKLFVNDPVEYALVQSFGI